MIAAAQQIENDADLNLDVPDESEVTEEMREQGRALLTKLHKAAGRPIEPSSGQDLSRSRNATLGGERGFEPEVPALSGHQARRQHGGPTLCGNEASALADAWHGRVRAGFPAEAQGKVPPRDLLGWWRCSGRGP